MEKQLNILGIAGSLRRSSYNKALLRTAVELTPPDIKIDIFDLEGIPVFNQDLESTPPEIVRGFKAKIKTADAILFATAEYNYSIPGVLKNAIDWASRPYGDNAWDGKPVAVMSASTGALGGARAQYHLRQVFVTLNMHPLNRPEVMVTFAPQKFDDGGKLTDDTARELMNQLLVKLAAWTRVVKTP